MSTWVFVDDSDPKITYHGNWTVFGPDANSTDIDLRLTEDGTMHAVGINATGASFTYDFIGSQVALFGTALIFNISAALNSISESLSPEPTWECILDGKTIPNNKPYGAYPLQSYCEADGLNGVAHTIELRVTNSTGFGFWFDYLRYFADPSQFTTVPANATAWFDHTDPRMEFKQGWVPIASGIMTTTTTELQDPVFFMNFNGSSVKWRGLSKAAFEIANPSVPALSMGNTTTVSGLWTIDGATPSQMFTVDLAADTVDDNGNPYSVVLFDTSKVPVTPGPHNLTVYYEGNSTVWPLTLDFLTIADAFPVVDPAQTPTASTPGGPIAGASSSSSKAGTIGGAVGGVLGGLLFIGLLLFLYRRWQVMQRQRKRRTLVDNLGRNDIQLRPFE